MTNETPSESPHVTTLFLLARDATPEVYRLLGDAIRADRWDGPVILAPEGLVTVTSFTPQRTRLVANALHRTDEDMIKNHALAVEVHVIPTHRFSLALWGARLLAKLLGKASGIDCQITLIPSETGA